MNVAQSLQFTPQHVEYLTKRGVTAESALDAGLRSVTPEEGARLLGFEGRLSVPGLAIPYLNRPDYVRIRLDDGPDRWLAPAGRPVPIYIPPNCLRDSDAHLYIVEGPVKALGLQNSGFNAVGLGGTATTLTKSGVLNDSWAPLGLPDREVTIVFDAGASTNCDVARAQGRLAVALERGGATVKLAALPARDDGGDQGPDDFLVSCGEAALRKVVASAAPADPVERARAVRSDAEAYELLGDMPFCMSLEVRGLSSQKKVAALLRPYNVSHADLKRAVKDATRKPPHSNDVDVQTATAASIYELRDGVHCLVSPSKDGAQVAQPLCNFVATIVEDQTRDDGSSEKTRLFLLDGVLANGTKLPRISVAPAELADEMWPIAKWGSRVSVAAALVRSTAHLRGAIQANSRSAETCLYSHTGFREHNGEWVYLHAGGAIGAEGISVELDDALAKCRFPVGSIDDIKAALRVSLSFLDTAHHRITYPLHSAAYRAPLQEILYCDATVAMHGPTGVLKSSIAAVAQAHFGDFDHTSLPCNWSSTPNSIELSLFRAKDMLVTIDDFVPSGDVHCDMHKKGAQVLRGIGNESARGRLGADCAARANRPCRALVVSTGEDLPRGESVQARTVGVSVKKGDVDPVALRRLQDAQHHLPHAMRGYIDTLRRDIPTLRVEVPQRFRRFLNESRIEGHLRAPTAIAHLLLGAYYFVQFARRMGVMTESEGARHMGHARDALRANYFEQVRATAQSNPATRFMEVLRTSLVQGKVALQPVGRPLAADKDGVDEIGWKDDVYAYILPLAALHAVNSALQTTGELIPLHPYGLWKRMAGAGIIVCDEGGEPTAKFAGDGTGQRVRVLKILLARLTDEGPPETETPPPVPASPSPAHDSSEEAAGPAAPSVGPHQSGRPAERDAPLSAFCQNPEIVRGGYTSLAIEALRAGRVGIALAPQGLYRQRDWRVAIAIPQGATHVVDLASGDLGPLRDTLAQVLVVGHDMKSLLELLFVHAIEAGACFDTFIARKILDGGVHEDKQFFDLAELRDAHRGESEPDVAEERFQREARLVLERAPLLRRALAGAHVAEVADLEFSLLPIVAQMQSIGVAFDRDRWEAVTNREKAEADVLRDKLAREWGILGAGNDRQVLAALVRNHVPVCKTNSEVLAPFMHLPIVQDVTRYRKANGFVRSLGTAIKSQLETTIDNRVRATLNQIGRTGRMSCEAPNLLGLPRDPEVRACVVAAPGSVLIVGDYVAIEMRVLADQTGDEALCRLFAVGGDPHRHTASLLFGISEDAVSEEQRLRAKPVNFGIPFGMGPRKLVSYAAKSGVTYTLAEATMFRTRFLERHPRIAKWQEDTKSAKAVSMRTKSGRVAYYFPTEEGYNSRLAYAIQGSAADGMKMGMLMVHARLKPLGARIVLAIHDELLVEAPPAHAEEVCQVVRECMIAGMQRYVRTVPIVVEPRVCSNWAKA